jgi:DNA polymerase-3 subunit epsilon
MPLKETFTVIDLETTGPLNEENHVIDVGIVRIERGKAVKTYQTLVRPPIPIPSSITRLTGIQDEDLRGAPSFAEVAPAIESFFENAVFTAHNAPFDYSFLNLEFIRLGRRLERPVLCTKNLAHRMFPAFPKLGLDALAEHFKIAVGERHRALPDAELTANLLLELFRHKGVEQAIRNTLASSGDLMPIPPPSFFDHLPRSSGIYRFHGRNDSILFIGSAKNVYLRAMIHFLVQIENKIQRHLCRDAVRLCFTPLPTELESLIEEAREIREHRPRFNRLLQRWHPGAYLWVTQEDFPQLLIEPDPAESPEFACLGPYPSRRFLDYLVDYARIRYHLCQYRLNRFRRPGRHFPPLHPCAGLRTHQCSGACMGKVDAKTYQRQIREVMDFFKIPLEGSPEAKASLLKRLKSEKLNAFGGSWRVKRSLIRMLEECSGAADPESINCIVEEKDLVSKTACLYLISRGLLLKSVRLEPEGANRPPEEELRAQFREPALKDPAEAAIERLVIRNYLSRPDRPLEFRAV